MILYVMENLEISLFPGKVTETKKKKKTLTRLFINHKTLKPKKIWDYIKCFKLKTNYRGFNWKSNERASLIKKIEILHSSLPLNNVQ